MKLRLSALQLESVYACACVNDREFGFTPFLIRT